MTPMWLIETARSYLGTPFQHQGRLPGLALDCAGVIVCAARSVGLPIDDVIGYTREPDGHTLQAEAERQLIAVRDWQPGDVLLMRYLHDPRHIALFTGDSIIHAHSRIGRVVEQRLDERLKRQVVSAWRFREFG